MRYLKWTIIVIIAAGLVFELMLNLPSLGQAFTLKIGLPWYPIGALIMPVWLALIAVFVAAFVVAVILEIGAWYEYSRVIRLQRKQIIALQEALDLKKNSGPARP